MFTVIWNMKIIYCFALIFIKNAAALDIAAAFEKRLFEKLHLEEGAIEIHYYKMINKQLLCFCFENENTPVCVKWIKH